MKRRNRPDGRKGKERKKGRELGEIWMERRVGGGGRGEELSMLLLRVSLLEPKSLIKKKSYYPV